MILIFIIGKTGIYKWIINLPPVYKCDRPVLNLKNCFTSGYATGLKIQRIQELGLKIPVTSQSFYEYSEQIPWIETHR